MSDSAAHLLGFVAADDGDELARAELYGLLAGLWLAPPDAALLQQFAVAVTQAAEPGAFLEPSWQALVSALRGGFGRGRTHRGDEIAPGRLEVAAGLRRLRDRNAELRQQRGIRRRQPQLGQQAVELGAGQFFGVVAGGERDRLGHGGQRSVMRCSFGSVWMSITRQSAHMRSRCSAVPWKAAWPDSLPIITSIARSVPKGLPQRMQA